MDPGQEESDERCRALFESLDCVYVHDLEGRFLDANRATLKLIGYRREELHTLTLASLLDDEQLAMARGFLAELATHGRLKARQEFRISRKNREYVDVEVNASVIFRGGQPHAVLGIARDISERKQVEAALRESEARHRLLADNAGDVIWTMGADGYFTYVSPSVERMRGYTAAEVMQHPLRAAVTPESAAQAEAVLADANEAMRAGRPFPEFRAEFEQPCKDGSTLWTEHRVSVMRDEGGRWIGFLGVTRDIVERKQAEEALQQSEERFKELSAMTSEGIMIHDEGIILDANRAFADLMSCAQISDLVGKNGLEIMPLTPESRLRIGSELLAGSPEAHELEFVNPDGSIRSVETRGRQVTYRGRQARLVSLRDDTERKRAVQSLKESEAKYRTVVDSIHEAVLVASRSRVLYYNIRVPEILGYAAEELDELDFGAALHPDDRADAFRRLLAIVDQGAPSPHFELRLVTKAGDVRTMSANPSAIDWQGEPAVIVFLDDITEHKRAEADQELSREILEILNAPGDMAGSMRQVIAAIKAGTGFDAVGIRLRDGEDFPYVAEDGFSEDFLRSENTLVERDPVGEVCRGQNGDVSLPCTCGLVISGRTDPTDPLFTKGGSFWTNDASVLLELPPARDPRLRPRNVCIQHGYASIALVPIRDQQRIVGLLHLSDRRKRRLNADAVGRLEGIAAHIGAALVRRNAEAALQESQERYQTLVNLSPDAIVVDAGGRYAFANLAAARVFRAGSPRELIGTGVIEHMHPDYREVVAERAALATAGAVTAPREIKILRMDGTTGEVEASAARIEYDGRGANLVVLRDITERKRAEARERELERQLQERQKLESLGVLAGGIAHDFNNMLTAILGYSHMILASDLSSPDDILSDVSEIKEAAERAKALTGAILAFSRRQPREPQIVALNSLVVELEPLLRRTLGEDIDMVYRLSPEARPVEMDPSQFTQVLMNLVVNARDATPAGGTLTLEVTHKHLDERCADISPALSPGDWAVLAVSDTGVGMDSAVLSRIFEPFFTTKGPGEGTGLGLSTAYGIVTQSGGEIVVRSEVGKGTTFEVYLPCVDVGTAGYAGPGAGQEREAKVAEPPSTVGQTILLVEDEAAVRKLAARLLREQGYTVVVASDGPQALDLARDRSLHIDVLLTDVVLPGVIQGDEVARSIVRERPELKVLFMSGYPRDAVLHSGRLDDGINYLDKPFTADALAAKLREVLDKGA